MPYGLSDLPSLLVNSLCEWIIIHLIWYQSQPFLKLVLIVAFSQNFRSYLSIWEFLQTWFFTILGPWPQKRNQNSAKILFSCQTQIENSCWVQPVKRVKKKRLTAPLTFCALLHLPNKKKNQFIVILKKTKKYSTTNKIWKKIRIGYRNNFHL